MTLKIIKTLAPKQTERYQQIIKKWQLALQEKKEVIVAMDDNIDTDTNSNHNKKYKIKHLMDMLEQHKIDFEIFQHNDKLTRFQSNCQPSTLDHLYSNCPSKITDVQTIKTSFSDHCIISGIYNSKDEIYKPKFSKVRKSKLLSKKNYSYSLPKMIL